MQEFAEIEPEAEPVPAKDEQEKGGPFEERTERQPFPEPGGSGEYIRTGHGDLLSEG
jgi:hypothetical protein